MSDEASALLDALEACDMTFSKDRVDLLAARLVERQDLLDRLQRIDVSSLSEHARQALRARLQQVVARDQEVLACLTQALETTRQMLGDLGLRRTASRGYANASGQTNRRERRTP